MASQKWIAFSAFLVLFTFMEETKLVQAGCGVFFFYPIQTNPFWYFRTRCCYTTQCATMHKTNRCSVVTIIVQLDSTPCNECGVARQFHFRIRFPMQYNFVSQQNYAETNSWKKLFSVTAPFILIITIFKEYIKRIYLTLLVFWDATWRGRLKNSLTISPGVTYIYSVTCLQCHLKKVLRIQ